MGAVATGAFGDPASFGRVCAGAAVCQGITVCCVAFSNGPAGRGGAVSRGFGAIVAADALAAATLPVGGVVSAVTVFCTTFCGGASTCGFGAVVAGVDFAITTSLVAGTARGLSGVTIFCVPGWGDPDAGLEDEAVASGLGVVDVSSGDGPKNFFTPEKKPPF